jgi:hypothetical protein
MGECTVFDLVVVIILVLGWWLEEHSAPCEGFGFVRLRVLIFSRV